MLYWVRVWISFASQFLVVLDSAIIKAFILKCLAGRVRGNFKVLSLGYLEKSNAMNRLFRELLPYLGNKVEIHF